MIQILDCQGAMGTVTNAVDTVLTIIRWAIPVVLIILGSIDMFKAMTKGDDKEQAKVRQTFIRRLIYALVAFLIPFFVNLAFSLASRLMQGDDVGDDLTSVKREGGFIQCWNINIE